MEVLKIIDKLHKEYGRGNELMCGRNNFLDMFDPKRREIWNVLVRRINDFFKVANNVTALQFSEWKSGAMMFQTYELIQRHYFNFGELKKILILC